MKQPPLTQLIGPMPVAVATNAGPIADRVADFTFKLAAEIAQQRGVELESDDGALLTLIVVGMVGSAVEKMCPAHIDPELGRLLLTVQGLARVQLEATSWSPDAAAERRPKLTVVGPSGS